MFNHCERKQHYLTMISKKGDLSLSFGTIFSIIVIVAIISVAVYAITYFVGLKKCTEISLFYKNLQDTTDRAWNSDSVSDFFRGTLPESIEEVCIGNLSQAPAGKEYTALKIYIRQNANIFLYPPKKACEAKYISLKHADIKSFSCVDVKNGQISLKVRKSSYDTLVTIEGA